MSVRQVVLCLVSVVGLSGCVSYTFQDTDYGSFAKAWTNTHSCNEPGSRELQKLYAKANLLQSHRYPSFL